MARAKLVLFGATFKRKRGTDHDQVLLSHVPQSGKGCALPRRNQYTLRINADRYPQGRTAHPGIHGNQSQRQDARHRGRQDGDLRQQCDPALFG